MKKVLLIVAFVLNMLNLYSQVISVTGVGVSGRFNTCTGSNIPTVTANLISTGPGSSVSGGLFTCLDPCDSSTIRVTISNVKWNKNPNNEWLHGLFLPGSAGFSVSPVTIPLGFITYNAGCAGMCASGSGTNGGPGFYFDNTAGNSCCPGITANDGFPCNNYGDVTMGCGASLSLTFDLTFCNSIITSSSYQFVFTGSSDGETGCYNFNDGQAHHVTFTISTSPCTPININPTATNPVRTCVGNTINYTTTLTGTCNANTIHWWSAATGGTLLGTGSPFVYDPAGSACPGGTTLYATCCGGASTVCVPRTPITIPGACNPLVISAASATNTNCNTLGAINSVTVLNAQGITNYTLNPGGITNTSGVFSGLNQTTYTVTVSDASGCTATTALAILQPPVIAFSSPAITTVTCLAPALGQIIISASGGTGGLVYTINPVSTQPIPGTFTGLTSQTYTVKATDAVNCTATTVVTLLAPPLPLFSPTSAMNISCNGLNDGSISATASGGTGTLNYTLQPIGTSNASGNFSALSAGVYTIQVMDANGCTATTTATIINPAALSWSTGTATGTTCSYLNNGTLNAFATGGTSTILYQLLPIGTINTTGLFSGLSFGTYTVKAADANNCSITSAITITQAVAIIINSPIIISPLCNAGNNGSIAISATGGTGLITYTLNPGGASNTSGFFSTLTVGNYTITVSDNNACTTSTIVSISQPPVITFNTANFTSPLCNAGTDGSINVNASGGTGTINYNLQPGGITNATGIFTSLSATTYTIKATDANGCSKTTVLFMTQPTAVVFTSATHTNVSCNGAANGTISVQAGGGTGLFNYTLQPGGMTNATGNFSSLSNNTFTVTATDANGCTKSTSIIITQPTPVTWVSASHTNVSCNGGSNGTINVTATGGTGTINYTLSPIGTANTSGAFISLSANTYTVIAADANGCTITTSITITQALPLQISNVTHTPLSCVPGNDASITITGSGGTILYSYSIGGANQSSNVFTNLGAGTYTVKITDANGCTITSVHTIVTPNAPIISNTTHVNVSCNAGANGSISVTATGGTGSCTYTLLPGAITNSTGNFNGLPAQTYTVKATDALGCTVSTSIAITQPLQLTWTSTTHTNVTCNGASNGTISVHATGGTGTINYTLQPGAITNTTGNFSPLVINTFTVTATDANGCTKSTTISITQPTQVIWASVTHINVSCNGGTNATINVTATGGSGIINYTLSPIGTANTTGSFTSLPANTYTVMAVDANGCSITTAITITQPLPLLISNVTNTIPSCVPGNDASMSITGSGGTLLYTYSIGGPGQLSNVFTNLGTGTYTVKITDANGCTVTNIHAITAPNAPIVSNTSHINVSCNAGTNGSISVTTTGGTGSITYNLLPGSSTNATGNFSGLAANTYTVKATDAAGCTVSTIIFITQPAAIAWTSATHTNISCNGGGNGTISVQSSGGTGTINYTLQPGAISNSTGNFSSLVSNTFTVIATDANGCTKSTTIVITQPTQLNWSSTISTNVSCNAGTNGTITATASGGTGIVNYTLLPTGTVNTSGAFNLLTANTYTIKAVDANGCSITTSITITQASLLLITNVINTTPSCIPGNDASMTITAIGGTLSYAYSIGGSAQSSNVFTNLGAGTFTITITDAHGCTATNVHAIVTPNAPIFTTALSNNVNCNGGNNGTISVTATGGTGTINYTLQPGSSTNTSGNFGGLIAQTFTVTATDNIGCAVSTTLIITQPSTILWISTTNTNVNCNGGNNATISVQATGGTGIINYTMQPGAIVNTSGNFSSLPANIFTITATDANGCTKSTSIVITQPTSLSWSSTISTNVSCNAGTNGTITATASGGTGIVNYTLLPTGTVNTSGAFNSLTANTYTIKAVDVNGCSITTSITITQPSLLLITNVTNTLPSCVPGNDASITINGNGGTLSYLYSIGVTNQTTNIFTNLGAATYTVKIIDANGCTATSILSVITPNAPLITNIISTNASCIPGNDATIIVTANGGTGSYSYALNPLPYQSSNLFTGLGGATYTVIVKDAVGCTVTSLVTINAQPSPSISSISLTNASCIPGCDGIANIVASGGSGIFTYSLNGINYQTSAAFNSLCTNQYTVTVKDGNGCTVTSTYSISTANGPSISNSSSSNVLCNGANTGAISVQVTGGSGIITYTLQPSGVINNTGVFSSLSATTYTVVASDVNGCTANTILQITQAALLQFNSISSTGTLCNGAANGSLSAPATGGTGIISYTINPAATFNPPSSFTNLSGNTTYTITATDANNCSVSTSIYISQASSININNVISNNVSCHGANDASINVTANGGTGILNFVLQPGAVTNNTGSFTNLSGNIYTVTISDANNCTASTTLTVIEPPAITLVNISSTTISCNNVNNGSITISCTGGIGILNYTLQPTSVTNTSGVFTALSGNTYTILVTDATNCSYTTTVIISNPLPIQFSNVTHTNVICSGDSNASITILANGGSGAFTYTINPLTTSNTSGQFISLPANMYTITAVDALNCSISTTVSILQPPPLTGILVSTQDVTCFAGNDGALTVSATGGFSPYQYTILSSTISNTTGIFTNLGAGVYSVQLIDSSTCTAILPLIVINEPPQLHYTSVNHQDISCFGFDAGSITVSAVGGTGAITFSVLPAIGLQNVSGAFTNLTANSYTVIATDGVGCTSTMVVDVIQNADITFTRIDFKEPTCHGDIDGSILADAVGGVSPLSFQLNGGPPSNTAYFPNLPAGMYILSIIDAVGCKKDTTVFLNEPDLLIATDIEISPLSCEGSNNGSIIIHGTGGTGPLTYYLGPSIHINQTGEFFDLPVGLYNITIKDSLGCKLDTTASIALPSNPMMVSISKQDLSCTGTGNEGRAQADVIGGEPPYTFEWNTNPPQFTSSIHDLFYGFYIVDVADANGCSGKDTVYIAPGDCCNQVFIPNAFSPNGDGTNDVFKVTTTAGIDLLQFAVYDRWGNKIWSTTDFRAGWDGTYKKKPENNGTYFYIFWYECLTDGEKYMRKGDVMIIR